ncbi:Protein of unknown function [Parasphingorhabdus marina DSM 22363]|uniref:DUF2793 domain-containing protein n=1 Tax=Parasphingorhabdus marina DSM 22363 TaxID=1123272 RepID=A0A1N6CM17_9SPHN|nr:DUF2793 domain-containing protein [Parasphingorhabdus marina]SIN59618.1 Protein of unknown function [Parasphingorhabdus marina DSM 22363]
MAEYHTARYELPLLAAGQAHKELFHNEAITLVDFLIDPVVQAITADPGLLAPENGQCWLVAASATGDWAGHAGKIAAWTNNGWQFIAPVEGMRVMLADSAVAAIFRQDTWLHCDPVSSATAGTTIDSEARAVIDSILIALQTHAILPKN